MGLRVNKKRISNRAWSEVDRSAIMQRLAAEVQADKAAAQVIYREALAHVVGETGADVLLHHEVTEDGEVILSKGGLMAATAALLAGEGGTKDWSEADRRAAAQHLLEHYRQEGLGLVAPPKLRQLAGDLPAGEMSPVMAGEVTGEMAVEDVPLAPWVTADMIRTLGGETDRMEVVVKVPAGKSKRGWFYTPKALQDIVGEVNTSGLPAFLGHQKPENVPHEFPTPVTHWVGAKWDPSVKPHGAAFFRGVIDKAADDLKRWIKGRAIRQVSIFGMPTLATVGGEQHVVGYKPLSIDWTPLNRPGMPTEIVAIAAGEMDAIIPGTLPGDQYNPGGGTGTMNWKELARQILQAIREGHTTLALVAGEMGLTEAQALEILQAVAGGQYSAMTGAVTAVGEMAAVLGLQDAKAGDVLAKVKALREEATTLAGEMAGIAVALGLSKDATPAEIKQKAAALRKEREDAAKAARDAMVDKVVGEMVVAEAARPLFKLLLGNYVDLEQVTDEAALRKAAGEMLEQPEVKAALQATFREGVVRPLQPENKDNGNQGGGLVRRTVRI